MMKVIGFIGSPRKGGNTDLLVSEILRGAHNNGVVIEKAYLHTLNINPCDACDKCKTTGICQLNDDMMPFYNKIHDADAIVIGSPIYFNQESAQTKLFIDRWYAFFERGLKSRINGYKKGALVLVWTNSKKSYTKKIYPIIKTFEDLYELAGIKLVAKILAPGFFLKGEVLNNKKIMQEAFDLGLRLANVECQ